MTTTKREAVEICVPAFDEDRCGKCWRCKARDKDDEVAALYYELYRATDNPSPELRTAIIEKHRAGMLIYRSPSSAQLQHVAREK